MAAARKTRLDQALLERIASKTGKTVKYVREQVSKRASRLSVSSEAAQLLWAKEQGIGTAVALRKLPPHIQDQVRDALPTVFAVPPRGSSKEATGKSTSRAPDPVTMAIEYLLSDAELRSRCKDLLKRRKHLDRALREATTVLEDRIRTLSGLGGLNPEPLVNQALNPDPSKASLVVSTNRNEQEGFHSICRGIVKAFRNPAHHQLDEKVSPEDALKFCAFVDVLLDLLANATRQSS